MRRVPPIDRRRLFQALLAIWVVGLLALPAALWLLGSRQPILESRAKAEFPTLNRSTVGHEETYRELDTALLDRLPGRDRALDLHARIALDLFRDSPSPDVAIGDDGWLYYVPELAPCRDQPPTADPADAVEVLARTLVASGRGTTVVMPRSKLFVHDADAPSIDGDAEACVRELEERIEARLARTPGGLALHGEMRALEERGEPTFLKTDTHWNWRGRELFVRRVLDRVRPGLAREAGLRTGAERSRGTTDLTNMLGVPEDERDRPLEARRTPARPPAAGEVLLLGDSQLEQALINALPGTRAIRDVALPGAVYCNWSQLVSGACNDAISAARTIVVEKVAREMRLFTSACWLPLSLAGEQLPPGETASWERVDGGPQPSRAGAVELTASGGARLRVRGEGADVRPFPRLLRFPLAAVPTGADGQPLAVTLTQEPQGGAAPAPCATPAQARVGGSLFLPVPADVRVSDMVVRIDGAPGTRLAPPQEYALDGRVIAADAATG